MDRVRTLFAVHEANLEKRFDECALFTLPVGRKLDVLAAHAGKVAIGARLRHPQKQANKAPRTSLADSTDQLLGLRMSGKSNRYAGVNHFASPETALLVAARSDDITPD